MVRTGLAFPATGVIVAAARLLLGLGAAAACTQLMQSLLFGVEPLDSIIFAAMPSCSRRRHCLRLIPPRAAQLVWTRSKP
jgi:hypothetical protein